MRKTLALILALVFAAAPAYPSYDPSYMAQQKEEKKIERMGSLPACSEMQQYMFGDWECLREELANEGVTFSSTFTTDVLGNVSGGMKQGTRFDSSTGWDVNFDLEKFAGLIGTQFHI